jgi:DNA-binding winged helix-turn-helix (wHTH) protein/TolB-like protein
VQEFSKFLPKAVMALETKVLYEFGNFRVDPSERSLSCSGKAVPITPKSFEILIALIQSNGRLLTKDELMRKIWPDSFVEEANLTVNISALRKALGDTSDQQQYIETVPKLGYRFIATVSETRNGRLPEAPAATSTPGTRDKSDHHGTGHSNILLPSVQPPSRRRLPLVSVVLGLVLLGVGLGALTYSLYRKQWNKRQFAEEPRRLAILPFRNMRQDADSDFLGYSLADAIITKLGYVRTLRVRPSYAIERYRNQAVDIPKVAAALDVDTLLTGNFIRDGDDLRITCQLVDVKSQSILWKGAFDLRSEKLLTVQDNVAQQIIHGLELNLSSTEVERLKLDEPGDPLGYEYYLRGVDLYARSDFPMAMQMLEKSAEIDPNYALTWAYLGRSYNANGSFQLGGREYYRKAQAAFEKAISLQPAQIETRVYMANFLTDTGKVEQAVPLIREALKANPEHAELHWELGYAYRFAGMLQESVTECERARQLDPGVKINSSALNAYLYLGEYNKFLEHLPQNSDIPFHLFYRGFGQYYEGHLAEAAANFDRSFALNPSLLQAQVGKALSDAIAHQASKGIEILHDAENKIEQRGVGDSEAIYKLAQAYAVLGDKVSALRVLRHSIENGFFPYPYFVTDPLLASLRDEAEFAHLLQSARQRHEAFRNLFFR